MYIFSITFLRIEKVEYCPWEALANRNCSVSFQSEKSLPLLCQSFYGKPRSPLWLCLPKFVVLFCNVLFGWAHGTAYLCSKSWVNLLSSFISDSYLQKLGVWLSTFGSTLWVDTCHKSSSKYDSIERKIIEWKRSLFCYAYVVDWQTESIWCRSLFAGYEIISEDFELLFKFDALWEQQNLQFEVLLTHQMFLDHLSIKLTPFRLICVANLVVRINRNKSTRFLYFNILLINRRITCLKYLVLAYMLMKSNINPFDSQEAIWFLCFLCDF